MYEKLLSSHTDEFWENETDLAVDDYIYIYIYIYIITVLVITKSLCGFVSTQVQYNMASAQYLG